MYVTIHMCIIIYTHNNNIHKYKKGASQEKTSHYFKS